MGVRVRLSLRFSKRQNFPPVSAPDSSRFMSTPASTNSLVMMVSFFENRHSDPTAWFPGVGTSPFDQCRLHFRLSVLQLAIELRISVGCKSATPAQRKKLAERIISARSVSRSR